MAVLETRFLTEECDFSHCGEHQKQEFDCLSEKNLVSLLDLNFEL